MTSTNATSSTTSATATTSATTAVSSMSIRLGTRRSALATTQAGWVADRLRDLGHVVELVEITTIGDTSTEPLSSIGGTGVFATAIRRALLEGEIDVAVHSLKDLPVAPEPGLRIAAIPGRADARDALVARDRLTLGELPPGSVVGTGSPRRAAQLAALGLGLGVADIRGNVDTRISLVHNGSVDAVLLARAGLSRLGRLDEVTETLDPLQMLPAPGQGALAVECRDDRTELLAALAPLDDPDTRACVTAERALLAALEAGCTAPIGALAEVVESETGTELFLRAFAGSTDASIALRRSHVGPLEDPERVGRDLARVLLADGAAQITDPPSQTPAGSDGSLEPWTDGGRPPEPPAGGDRPPDQPEASRSEGLPAADTQPADSHPHRSHTERAS